MSAAETPLAQRLYPFGEERDAADATRVRMRDGVHLATDVYLPAGHRRGPAILIRMPYDKCGRYSFIPEIAGYLTEHGYVVVAQDVRGKFRSEGEREPFVHEVRDGWDTIEWVVGQSWSDGVVGMIGDSYYGFTQWAAAASGHPALRAIVPRVTGSRLASQLQTGGVTPLSKVEWVADVWSFDSMLESGYIDWSTRPLEELVPAELENARRLLREAREPRDQLAVVFPDGPPAPRLKIPALQVTGWWDNIKGPQLRDWADVQRAPAAAHQHLRLTITDHQDLEFALDGRAPEDMLASEAALERYLPRLLDVPLVFFDRWLRGNDAAERLPRVAYQVANGDWHHADAWPPPEARELLLHLADGGRATAGADGGALATDADTQTAVARWTHDPNDPVPTGVEVEWEILRDLPDERAIHARPDVATFTGAPAPAAVDLVGSATAELVVGAAAPSTQVVATLCDVAPSGRAHLVAEGVACPQLGDEGEARCTVDLGAIGYRLLPGHRLRLAVASSRYPRYLLHPGTGEDPWTALGRPAEQWLRTGVAAGSVLRLAVLPS